MFYNEGQWELLRGERQRQRRRDAERQRHRDTDGQKKQTDITLLTNPKNKIEVIY